MRLAALAALGLALAACGEGLEAYGARLPNLSLVMPATGAMGAPLSSCSTDKCLTVVVAPWCPVCHSVTENIRMLQGFLKVRGVESRVVVGLSPDYNALKEYAAEFGPDAQIDLARALRPSGVPMFIVSDRKGKIVKTFAGYPGDAETSPKLAAALGL